MGFESKAAIVTAGARGIGRPVAMWLAAAGASVVIADVDERAGSLEQWQRALSVTLEGTFLCLRAELRQMAHHGGGAIFNVASIAGLQSTPMLAPYGASKHGVVSLTRSTAAEYARRGVRINAVAPGAVDTDALVSLPAQVRAEYGAGVPLGRLDRPEEIASGVVWLLSDEASFITGVTLPIDGGTLSA